MNPLLDVRDLTLDLPGPDGTVPILTGVDLTVGRGEALGLVGESGSGKSMTLRCVARLAPPGAEIGGTIAVVGTDVAGLERAGLREYRRRQVGFIFQDPRTAINPVRRVGDFLLETGGERAAAIELLERMGVDRPAERMRQYPFQLSGGLLQRVMIASVLLARPALVLADEPTTALDVSTQSDVLAITDELRRERGTAMVFVTHDLDLALAVCDRVAVLYAGTVLEVADRSAAGTAPRHPYTRGLLASRPPLSTRLKSIPTIGGAPVSAAEAGPGCPYAGRCPVALARCAQTMPEPTAYPGGSVRCHRAQEVASGALDDRLPLRLTSGGRP